jgi:hypothetical protein
VQLTEDQKWLLARLSYEAHLIRQARAKEREKALVAEAESRSTPRAHRTTRKER